MKRLFTTGLIAATALGLAACSQHAQNQTAEAGNAIAADTTATTSNAVNDVDAATDRALDKAENSLDRTGDALKNSGDRAADATGNAMVRAGEDLRDKN
ncbi:hypothetical protein [Sphingomonas sp. 8AM]|uniref:hypothetical protein n=1 Tax=Sphingomonas sp. 8AM TaxID=2653170 RepID=UPI0012F446FC|nr:hypothetical protein [Sphingomonas sp. 8AM]VXC89580.1 conserved exported hypothetical protein [Sphingomonas sp. 8AM]